MAELIIAIDIGGTKIAGAVISEDGQILRAKTCSSPAAQGANAVMDCAVRTISELITPEVVGIGVSSGGQINPATGEVIHATDMIPGWKGTQISRVLRERFALPVKAVNDGTAATLGEWRFGAAKGVSDFVCMTIGTGIGGGIVAGSRLLEGALGVAGSVGHMVISVGGRACGCGNRGCLEAYSSGTAIIRRILELADERGVRSDLIDSLKSGDARSLVHHAGEDALAREAVREAGEYLGWGIVTLLNLLNPAMIVIGGGVSALGDLLLDPAREIARTHSLRGESDPVPIVQAKLGNEAGLLGAASLVSGENTDHTD